MKLQHKHILSLLLVAALMLTVLPMQALADTGWTEYGRSGHATASGDTVSFRGHPSVPFTTLLYRPAEDGDYRKFTFHMTEGNSDWHTLEGSGFVFNADISNGVINGYALLFGQSNVGYYKLANVAVSSLAGSHFTAVSGVSLIQQAAKPAFSSGTTWYLELLVSPGSMSFYVHSDASFGGSKTPIFNNIAIGDSVGSGYGPFGSFISHDCSVISTSNFEYFRLAISPNTAPVVSAPDVVLERGAAFDAMSGVSAQDNEDGDVSASLKITANDVDTTTPGVYGVTYTATDILGLAGTHTRKVTVRADIEIIAIDALTKAPISGVGVALSGAQIADTNGSGKASTVLDPGTYNLSVTKAHPDYIAPGDRTVAIDGAHFDAWPAQIVLELTPKQYDMALSIQLAKVGETAPAQGDAAKYGDILTYQVTVRNEGNQTAIPTVRLNVPDGLAATEGTAATLQDGAFALAAIAPGDSASMELTFRVAAISAAVSLKLQASAILVATSEGEAKADIDPSNNNDEATASVVNPPVVLTVVNALDDTDKLAGAELKLVDAAGNTVFTGATGQDGTVKANGVYPGKYNIVQTKAVTGYQLPTATWAITKADNGIVTGDTVLPNEPTLVNITNVEILEKAEKLLLGGKISIIDAEGKEVQSGTIREDGTLTYRYLPAGKYTLKQTAAPAGYVLQTKEYPFTIDAAGQVTGDTKIVNAPTTVIITKTDPDKKPVEGALYEVYDAQGKKTAENKTDKDGKLTVTHLPAGKYTYKEVKAPSGYALNPEAYAFEIDEKGAVTGTLAVIEPFANIVVKKVDAKTKAALAGAKFGLYDKDDKLIENAVSDKNGLATFSKIPHGSYKVRELQAPTGYTASGKLIETEITETYQNPADPHMVENSPAPQTGVDGFPWWGTALLILCAAGGIGCAWHRLRKRQPGIDRRRK